MTEANRDILEGIKHDKSIHMRLNEISQQGSLITSPESTVSTTAAVAI